MTVKKYREIQVIICIQDFLLCSLITYTIFSLSMKQSSIWPRKNGTIVYLSTKKMVRSCLFPRKNGTIVSLSKNKWYDRPRKKVTNNGAIVSLSTENGTIVFLSTKNGTVISTSQTLCI